MMHETFPQDSAERKGYPVYSGLLQYFPSALAKVAHHSFKGNEKHNAGLPLHWDRAKSDDEADALLRHLMEGDYVGMAWRALALLQKHLEANGAPVAPGARNASKAAQRGDFHVIGNDHNFSVGHGIPVESSYFASFSPNDVFEAELPTLQGHEVFRSEQLREYGIGDIEPASDPRHPLHHMTLPGREL